MDRHYLGRLGWAAPLWHSPPLLWKSSSLLLCLMAFFNILWPAVGNPAETLMAVLGLGALLIYGGALRGHAALVLLAAATAVQVLSWWLGYLHHPQWVADNPEIDRLAKLFIFIAVAWWLGGSIRNTFILWILALVGLLIATFTHGDGWQEWWRGLHGERVGFGIRNNQHGSMLLGVALVGLVAFAPRCWGGRKRSWRIALWGIATVMCLVGVAIGQTRAIWLALLVALPIMAVVALVWKVRYIGWARLRRPLGSILGSILLVGGSLVAFFHDTLAERLLTEQQVVAILLEGNVRNLPYTSIGIRIHSWVAASEWIAERPWVGWGGEGRGLVIDETPWLPELVKEEIGHLHNFFIEIWVAYGVLGLAVIAALVIWINLAVWRAWRAGEMPSDMALFACGMFAYWMIINQFESYLSFSTGVTVHNLIVGGLVTHYWRACWLRQVASTV